MKSHSTDENAALTDEWWRSLGFSVAEQAEWSRVRLDPNEAKAWRDAGFIAGQVPDWREYRVDVATAQQWSQIGFTARDAVNWMRAKIPADEAAKWWGRGFDDTATRVWMARGFALEEAAEWRRVTRSRSESQEGWITYELQWAKDAQQWARAGFTPDEWCEWAMDGYSRSPLTARKAARWRAKGASPEVAIANVAERRSLRSFVKRRARATDPKSRGGRTTR